ncbi:MAG: tetratricopeptide repeat protein [Pyrinomonadaceae bacterium]|nr:tetratricopeptide repeat protein [Pyrinomonadaceae bacterium]
MLSRKGRIYSFGSLTLVGLVSSLVGVLTQSPEAGVAAGAVTVTAAQSGILSILQDKGFDLTIKLLEACGAIGLELGADDARQVLLEVSKKLKDNDGAQNHDIAKAVRQAILSILESEKEELTDKDDKASIELILETTQATWAWVVLLEQDNLVSISEEKIPYFFSVKANEITKIESPVKESEWKLILLEIARQNDCNLTEISLNKLAHSLYSKFPQSLREVFVQDFANEGVAYGKLLLALVSDINASQAEILDEIINVSKKLDKYHYENREWFKALLQAIKNLSNPPDNSSNPSKIPTKLPVSRFPMRVQFFTGRKDVLIGIKDSLKTHKTAALCGVHGLGKSSVVTEFAYLNENNYKHIFFIRAVGADFDIFIGEIVSDLNIPTDEQTTPAQKLQIFQHWLAENDNWLLILDNVDDVLAIKDCRFTNHTGDVVFTANKSDIYDLGKQVKIFKMATDEAAQLLLRHKNKDASITLEKVSTVEAENARNIAEHFGNSPLAMSFVGSYLNKKRKTFAEFLDNYQDREKNLLANYEFLSNYFEHFKDAERKAVATAFLNTFGYITTAKNDSEKETFIARAVDSYLKISAFVAPENIPEDFFIECLKKLDPKYINFVEDEDLIDEVKERLYEFAIFDRDVDQKTFSTHRLVQEVMRFKLKNEEDRLLEIISETLNAVVPFFDYTNKEKVEPYLAHLESFIEYLVKAKENSADITKLDNQSTNVLSYKIARYNKDFGQYNTAKKYCLICRDICEKIYGNEHQETASSYCNLGNVYYSQGDYPNAEENHLKDLKICLNIFGENHPLTASSYNNLGNVYYSQGDYPKAEEYYLKSLQIKLNIFDENHPDMAMSYMGLGLVYDSQGDYPKAEENHLKALQIKLNIFGENHPSTAMSYNNLGLVYENQDKLIESEEYYVKALEIYRKFLSENHPYILQVKNNLKIVREKMGK